MDGGLITEKIKKAVNEIVQIGKNTTEGEAVVQITPAGKLDVNFYLGNGSFESYGLGYHDAAATVMHREKFDADSPKFFRRLNLSGASYRQDTIERIYENIREYVEKKDEESEI